MRHVKDVAEESREKPLAGVHEDRQQEEQNVKDAILETGRLFVRNLPYQCTDEDLTAHFKKFAILFSTFQIW